LKVLRKPAGFPAGFLFAKNKIEPVYIFKLKVLVCFQLIYGKIKLGKNTYSKGRG